jgi:hypothetical protein
MTGAVRTRLARAVYFTAAPLVCLLFFWRVPLTWFRTDDFAWLSLPLSVHNLRSLEAALFHPQAQGTVRVLSERLFFLVFSSVFGLHALPYRLWILSTWFADLALGAIIGVRLTGSRAAGLLAAILWTTSANIVTPLIWASAYNEVLCGFFLLSAFYARLRWIESGERKWILLEWAAYLAGFGALEVIVMYPAIALLYALCADRRRWRSALPLWLPAIAFAAAHFFLIPKQPSELYAVIVDQRLPANFLRYLAWAVGPSQMGALVSPSWRMPGLVATALIGAGLAAFFLVTLLRRRWIALFCFGWFVLLLAPMLPLPNHVSDYYLTLPELGLAWLAGWGIASAWRRGIAVRIGVSVLLALYLAGSAAEIDAFTDWYYTRTARMRELIRTAQQQIQAHSGAALLLQGVDNDLFGAGFQDNPFRLVGASRVYLAPGSEQTIESRLDLGGTARFEISADQALALLEHGQARVIEIAPDGAHDVTRRYTLVARSQFRDAHRTFVDVGDPFYASRLGPSWYPPENGFRWMPATATVQTPGPRTGAERLYITGYAPAQVVAAGPLTLRVQAAGHELGAVTLRTPDEKFAFDFPLSADLAGRETIEVKLAVNRVFHPAGETRDLGLIFGTFEIR